NCSRYKLAGSTGLPSESNTPFGPVGDVTGLPTQPMHQLIVPGGCCTTRNGDRAFHATDHPISQPCPEPMVARLVNAMPAVRSAEPGKLPPSTNRPVAQR